MSKKKKKNTKYSLESQILKIFQINPRSGFTYRQLLKKVGKNRYDKAEIIDIVQRLVELKKLHQSETKKIYLFNKNKAKAAPAQAGDIIGKVDMTRSGGAYILIDGWDDDVYVPPHRVGRAFDGDTVRIELRKGRSRNKSEGEIVEIMERKSQQYVGTMQISEKFAFFVADNDKIPFDFFVKEKKLNGAKDGDKVLVEMLDWAENKKSPNGEVIKVLGKPGDNEVEMLSILLENGFPLEFSDKVMAYADKIPIELPKEEVDMRVDYREITTFTIDPDDAKDFDDALSVQKLDNGNWEIGVHIADVSHYCKEGSNLDKEAYERATSVYLVDRVLPMLPEKLSNGVCSLRPQEEKFCFSAIFEMNENGEVLNTNFARTVIFSDRRFTYNEAQERIESGEGDFAEEIKVLNDIALKLRKERFKNGSINFDTPEVKFKLDEKGKPVDVYLKERKEAHLLVEDFMLLANKKVAHYFSKYHDKTLKVPAVYRIHDRPEEERLEKFKNMASKFGYKFDMKTPKQISSSLNKVMDKIQGKPEQNLLENLALRSMAKAEYSTNNIGHYGLGFEDYTHFTSPIRRYPDLMVHRVLQQMLDKKPQFNEDDLKEKCRHCSQQERNAMQSERDSVKYKQVEYLSERVGEEYEGVISGVTQFGVYVMINENYCEGLVHQSTLTDDKYFFDEDEMAMVGFNKGKKYRLGSPAKIVVVATDLEQRQVDFEMVE